MSGGLPTEPADLVVGNYAIECKQTDKKSFAITQGILDKLWSKSLDLGKMPKLIIGIPKDDSTYYLVSCDIQLKRKER